MSDKENVQAFLNIINTTPLPSVLNTERARICYRKALQEWAARASAATAPAVTREK